MLTVFAELSKIRIGKKGKMKGPEINFIGRFNFHHVTCIAETSTQFSIRSNAIEYTSLTM